MNEILSENHRRFLEELADLLYKYHFDTIYASEGRVMLTDTEGRYGLNTLYFKELHEGSFIDVVSSVTTNKFQYDKIYDMCDYDGGKANA